MFRCSRKFCLNRYHWRCAVWTRRCCSRRCCRPAASSSPPGPSHPWPACTLSSAPTSHTPWARPMKYPKIGWVQTCLLEIILYKAVEGKFFIWYIQVWVGSLKSGTSGEKICCISKYTSVSNVQDDLGEMVYGVCDVTPHGVLCFLPSYRLMNLLVKRLTNSM